MRVETYSSNVGIDGPAMQGVNPSALGTGRGLQAFGEGLNQAAQAAHAENMRQKHILEQQADQDAHLWSMNTMSDLRQNMLVNLDEAKNNAPDGADGFTGAQNKVYEQTMKNLLEQAPNGKAKLLFEASAREFQNQYFAHALQFESAEKQRFRLQSITDGAKMESNEIDQAQSPLDAYKQLVTNRLAFIDTLREDPATRAKIKDGISTHYSKTLVLAEARRDPHGTLAKIDDGTYTKLPGWNLYGDQLESIRRGIEVQASRADHSTDAAIKDWITEFRAKIARGETDEQGRLIVPKVPFEEAAIARALGPVGYKNWKEEQEYLPIAQQYVSAMAVNPPEYASKAIKQIRSDIESGKLSAKLGNSVEEYVTKQAQAQDELRRKDPASAAEVAATRMFPEYATGNKADQLLLREAAQIAAFGQPKHSIRLLTEAEAKTMARDLASMDIDKAQEWMANLEQQLTPSGKIAVNVQGADGANTDHKRLTSQVMSELFAYGKLDKGFMFMNFTADTKYGNYFAKAMRIQNEDQLTGGLPSQLTTDVKKALDSNPELQRFSNVMRMSAGESGAEYASVLKTLVRRTAYMTAGDASSPDAESLVKNIVQEVVSNQVSINNTYYVPAVDHITGRPLDAKRIDEQLKLVGDAWTNTRGERFIPDVKTTNAALRGRVAYMNDATMNPRDGSYVWLSLEDGTGVYRAIPLRGSSGANLPGAYAPVLDANRQRYELRFKELESLANLTRNPSIQSRGVIR